MYPVVPKDAATPDAGDGRLTEGSHIWTPMLPIFTRTGDNRAALEVTLGENGAADGDES